MKKLLITDKFENYLIDVWGVIIDGKSVYSDGIDFLRYLKNKGKNIILVSNTPLLSHDLQISLNEMGITKEHYNLVVTAGDVTRDFIIQNNSLKEIGPYYLCIKDIDYNILSNSFFVETQSLDQASFLLLTGIPNHDMSTRLKYALNRELPIICANPDISIFTVQGEEQFCAGYIAHQLEQKGAKIIYIGKPYSNIYEFIYSKANITNKTNTAAIGDSLATDIVGANNQKLFSILVNRCKKNDGDKAIVPSLIVESLKDME